MPLTHRLDGLIVMSLPFSDEVAKRLIDQHVTTVLVEMERTGFSSVTIDDAAGGRMVADLLIAQGHERSGFIGEARQRSHRYVLQSETRLAGFRDGLSRRAPGLTSVRQPLEESGELAAATLLSHLANPRRSLQHITLKLSLVEPATA